MNTEIDKLNYIDFLRGIAILMVIVHHCGQTFNESSTLTYILSFGNQGVQLFFIVSAYTLFLSTKKKSTESYKWRKFYVRRIFRILPLYLIGIIYFTWQQGGIHQREWNNDIFPINILTLISNALLLHGLSPYTINSIVPGGWSIAAEFLFYSIFPFLFLKINSTKTALIALGIAFIVQITLHFLLFSTPLIKQESLWGAFEYFYFPFQLPAFLVGILCFYLIKENDRKVTLPIAFVFIALLIMSIYYSDQISFFIFTIIIFPILLFVVEKHQHIVKSKIIEFVGKISYNAYFIHFAVIYWFIRLGFFKQLQYAQNINILIYTFIVLIVTIIISTMTHYIIEIPFINLGKRLNHYLFDKKTSNE